MRINEILTESKHSKQGLAEGEGGLGQVAGIGINGKQFNFSIKDLIAKAKNYPIKKINPQCKFVIVSLCNDNVFNKYLLREDNYLSLNIYNYKISEFDNNDWKTDCWDWKKLFTNIPIYYDL